MTKFENSWGIHTILKFSHSTPTCPWRWNRPSVPKRRHIKFRCRGITQKKTNNIQNTAKVWNKEYWQFIWTTYLEGNFSLYLKLEKFYIQIGWILQDCDLAPQDLKLALLGLTSYVRLKSHHSSINVYHTKWILTTFQIFFSVFQDWTKCDLIMNKHQQL